MAPTTIIVGCDLSGPSDQALERAIGIAERAGARIVVVHAHTDDTPLAEIDTETRKHIGEASAEIRAHAARGLADRLAAIEARGVRAEVASRAGPPDDVLIAVAVEQAADLIVLGSHGHTGIARMLLGSVASSTIRHATCDVLVCRGPGSRAPFERPLVATDFSATASKALTHAAAMSAPDAPIEVIHAWQLPAGSWGASLIGQARFPWSTVRDAVVAGAQTLADKLVTDHASLGHSLHVELVQGPPASVITHAAERKGHDLIAVGAHGHRGVRRLLLGSVAESTIRHSPCSVLVVHGDPH